MFYIYSSTGEEFPHQLTEYQAAIVIMRLSALKPHNQYHMSPVLF